MGAPIRISSFASSALFDGRTLPSAMEAATPGETRVSSGGRIRTDDPGLMNPML